MDEVTFDRMIHTDYERHLQIEREYHRYAPVRSEPEVRRTYRSQKINKGRYKTLLQWEAQVRSDYSDREKYDIAWVRDVVKMLSFRRRAVWRSVLLVGCVFMPMIMLAAVAATVLYAEGDILRVFSYIATGVPIVLSGVFYSRVKGLLHRSQFYEEFARVLEDL